MNAFQRLKDALTSPPVLSYPDFSRPFIIRTDASTIGLGAVLCQDNGDKAGPQVIAYASRSLKPSEKHYSPYKLEFLAVYWAVTKKFSHYVQGSTFTVTTDHNPLTHVLTSAKLDSTGHRWLAELMNYHFDIRYKPGKHNGDADALSRLSQDTVHAICTALSENEWEGYAQCLFNVADVTSSLCHSVVFAGESVDWKTEQSRDSVLSKVSHIVSSGVHVSAKKESNSVLQLLRQRKLLQVEDGILYRISQGKKQVVLPQHFVNKVLGMAHTEMGHQGRDRTLSLCQERFFWSGMAKDIQEFIQQCDRCNRAKAPNLPQKAPLKPIKSCEPLEIVCMDYLSLECSKGGFNSILVITDHFTKYSMAIPTTSQTASNTAKLLLQHFIYRFGIPKRLHSDQGGSFEAKVIKVLCEAHGIKKSRTTPYHPEGDGITERFNRTLLNMLRTLENDEKQDWKSHIARLVHAFNCTPHSVTGFSPYFLMFGRQPRLPLDTLLNHREEDYEDIADFAGKVRRKLREAYEAAAVANRAASKSQKRYYDSRTRGIMPEVGDLVLVRKLGLKGKHKLADRWESDVYKIVSHDPNAPVYTVVKENGTGKTKVLHRNHIMPITWPVVKELTKPLCTPKQSSLSKNGSDLETDSSDDELPTVHVTVDRNEHSVDQNVEAYHTPEFSSADCPEQQGFTRSKGETSSNLTDFDTKNDQDMSSDIHCHVADDTDDEHDESDAQQVDVDSSNDSVEHEVVNGSDNESSHDDVVSDDNPPLRRSSRARKQPAWFQSGDYQVHQHQVVPCNTNWQSRCQFLLSVLKQHPKYEDLIIKAITTIVSRG
jgi:transposase InsO family protein